VLPEPTEGSKGLGHMWAPGDHFQCFPTHKSPMGPMSGMQFLACMLVVHRATYLMGLLATTRIIVNVLAESFHHLRAQNATPLGVGRIRTNIVGVGPLGPQWAGKLGLEVPSYSMIHNVAGSTM